MTRFRFRGVDGSDIDTTQWLRIWADRYPIEDYAEYDELIARHKSLFAAHFEQIGKWKDNAKTGSKWKANVASVAYPIWMQAATELPQCPEQSQVAVFLNDWAGRKYTDTYVTARVAKTFGLSRATTLLHFISGGRFPIFDSRVRRAMTRLRSSRVPNTVRWYLESYCPLFSEVAALCGTEDLRRVDMALFSYGARNLPFSD
jgi:hypothetical protein